MAPLRCPICERPNPPYADRCTACGADFHDPEVRAMLAAGGDGARPATAGGDAAAAGAATASLASDRFLGVSAAGLADGRHLARLAWIGGAAMVAAFLIPIDPDFGGLRMPWSLLGGGRTLAVLVPLLVGAAGIELAILGKRIPREALAGVLAVAGAAALVLGVRTISDGAGAPTSPPYLVWLGVAAAAVGVSARILRPLDTTARWVVAGGAVLALVGLVLGHADARPSLPAEFALYIRDDKLLHVSLLDASLTGLSHDLMVRLLALWHLVPLAAIPVAFALAMRRPSGPWDTKATGLRPLGWIIVLYVPLTYLLYAINIAGWETPAQVVYWNGRGVAIDPFMRALFAGRAHLMLLGLGASAWLVGGATALYLRFVPGPAAAPDAPDAPAPGASGPGSQPD